MGINCAGLQVIMENIVKVKFKSVKLPHMIKENMYVTNISFKHYNIDDNEGYYVNLINT